MPVTVIMYDQKMYTGGGTVHRWMTGVGGKIHAKAIQLAPVRSGELVGSIDSDVGQVAPRAVEVIVEATAPHAQYVIGGTGNPKGVGYIYRDLAFKAKVNQMLSMKSFVPGTRSRKGTAGMWMHWEDGAGATFALRVRGQKPNNFLVNAYNAVAATHRALRPMGARGGLL